MLKYHFFFIRFPHYTGMLDIETKLSQREEHLYLSREADSSLCPLLLRHKHVTVL